MVVLEGPLTGDFIVPAGVTRLMVEMWGGGAGSSVYRTSDEIILAGGGGGGYRKDMLNVSPGASISYVVGDGGENVSGPNPNIFQGFDGEDTTFDTLLARKGRASQVTYGTPNSVIRGGGGSISPAGNTEPINGGDGEVVLLNKISGIVYEDGHALGGSAPKYGHHFVANSSFHTEVSQSGPIPIPGGGGGCSYSIINQNGNQSPRYISAHGRPGRIIIYWKE
jgi:hypothetical protein